MGHPARSTQGVARVEPEPVTSHFDEELSVDGVEPLVLIGVKVTRTAAPLVECVFHYEHAVAIRWAGLEGNGAYADPPMLAEPVLASATLITDGRLAGVCWDSFIKLLLICVDRFGSP